MHDELPLGKAIQLKTGIRTTYSTELEKVFVEPRISASAKIRDKLKLNAGWGMYNQFLSETILVDTTYSYTEFWANADDEAIPLLSAEHYVGGLSYNSNGFTFSTEFFHKTTEGLNQYFRGTGNIERGFYEGKAKARGVDVFIKKEYKRHMAWISYTWCNAEEIFPHSGIERWIPSPHQQKHELKFAGIVNYKQFYFSTNYVYGSGFERYDNKAFRETNLSQSYSRLDAALIYKFRPGKIKVETGVSVLNIFDRDNIKYANIGARRIDEVNVLGSYANAVPFTPSLFLKIEL